MGYGDISDKCEVTKFILVLLSGPLLVLFGYIAVAMIMTVCLFGFLIFFNF